MCISYIVKAQKQKLLKLGHDAVYYHFMEGRSFFNIRCKKSYFCINAAINLVLRKPVVHLFAICEDERLAFNLLVCTTPGYLIET